MADELQLEVMSDRLPLFHGAKITVDNSLVTVLRKNGTSQSRCANEDGVALVATRLQNKNALSRIG